MNSKVPTGERIFADDTATKRGARSVAHFAVKAKPRGTNDAKTRRKLVFKPIGTTDAKTRKKLIVKPIGTTDAKTRRKILTAKLVGAGDAKTRRKIIGPAKFAGAGDTKTRRKSRVKPPGAADAKILRKIS